MAVVACIDAMFNTHTHTFGVSRGKNAVIDSTICRVSWKKLSWQKVSWKSIMHGCHGNHEVCSVMKVVMESDSCEVSRESRHGMRHEKKINHHRM